MTRSVKLEREAALAVVTLERPDVLNAFNEELTDDLYSVLDEVGNDASVRAVLLTGAGRGFSAGQDLRDREAALGRGEDLRLGDELRTRYHPIVTSLRHMAKPVVAAINGVVAGAGLGIACACDIRIAATSATFRAAWSRVGLVPDGGAGYFLPRIVGWGRALEMMLSGRSVAADEALAFGLVTRVWPDAEFAREAKAFALQLAAGPTLAYALTKQALEQAAVMPLDQFLAAEAMYQDQAGRSRDYAEGVGAFLAKRPAGFEGR